VELHKQDKALHDYVHTVVLNNSTSV